MSIGAAIFFSALLGACIGSFLNVCIFRWPLNKSVVMPNSFCPACERSLKFYENIPILSWLVLRGKCARCGAKISLQYPSVELLIAIVWALSAWYFGVGFTGLRVAVFVTIMVGVSVTDAKYYLIPDGFTVFGVLWLIACSVAGLLVFDPSPFATPYYAIIGACTGAGAIAITGWLGEVVLKREAMGFGDVTLMAVIGAALGPDRALLTIFIGAALGVLTFTFIVLPVSRFRTRKVALPEGSSVIPLVPFGVFLAPAAVIALLYGDLLISWYLVNVAGF